MLASLNSRGLTQGIGNVSFPFFITLQGKLLYASDPLEGTFLLEQERLIIECSLSDMLRQLVLQWTFG